MKRREVEALLRVAQAATQTEESAHHDDFVGYLHAACTPKTVTNVCRALLHAMDDHGGRRHWNENAGCETEGRGPCCPLADWEG